jgi:hypothetical protein
LQFAIPAIEGVYVAAIEAWKGYGWEKATRRVLKVGTKLGFSRLLRKSS